MTLALHDTGYQTGTLIEGKYRLMRCLGEGGMSWVWLAQHQVLDARVAMKIAKPNGAEAAAEPPLEARMTARLRHPSIVSVFDSGRTPRGDHYLVMEYLAGSTLSDVLARDAQLEPRAAVTLLLPVLDALGFCHDYGVVHRDIKPANIFLAREHDRTCAKLLDFGIAKPVSAPPVVPELTGTPGYMAPEQVHALVDTDHRADLWALCAVLYECIAGRPAIEGDSCVNLLRATLELAIAPLQANDDSASLWPILERGLRKDPAHRFQSANELRDALAQWLDDGQVANSRMQTVASHYVRPRRQVRWSWDARAWPSSEPETKIRLPHQSPGRADADTRASELPQASAA